MRFGIAFIEVVEVAGEGERDDEIVGAGRPHHADLVVWDADDAFLSETPLLRTFAVLRIPDFHRLICIVSVMVGIVLLLPSLPALEVTNLLESFAQETLNILPLCSPSPI